MSDRINDGQLDDLLRRNARLAENINILSDLCGKRFDLLKAVAESMVVCVGEDVSVVVISHNVMDKIREETDESEVEP